MTIDEMIRKKRELGYSYEKISELSGVPVGTVQKVFSGQTKAPRYGTICALERAFLDPPGEGESRVREQVFTYQTDAGRDRFDGWHGKKQGDFTLEDYYALPEDHQAELIDGVIYEMTSQTLVHQQILLFLGSKISNYIIENRGKSVVSIAPTDVRLDMDERTMVRPDLLVSCDREKVLESRIEGAPDLVIEILSTATRRKDLRVKSGKYAQAGVRELWLVDPRDRRIIAYEFEKDDRVSPYSFRDQIPVGIFDGMLQIDFNEITDYLDELFGGSWGNEETAREDRRD